MADFSDIEDRLLFQAAKAELDRNGKIDWTRVSNLMTLTMKTRQQLRQRLKTLKQTHGNDLTKFPRRFFVSLPLMTAADAVKKARKVKRKPKKSIDIVKVDVASAVALHASPSRETRSAQATYEIIRIIFSKISQMDVVQSSGSPHKNAGEVTPFGLTRLMSMIPEQVTSDDVFCDIGAGIGNIVAQVALQTPIKLCVGIELRKELVQLGQKAIKKFVPTYPELSRVWLKQGDICALPWHIQAQLQACTIVFANSVLFDAGAVQKIEDMVCFADRVRVVVVGHTPCGRQGRHSSRCSRLFCAMYKLHATIPIQVHWTSALIDFHVFVRIVK